MQCKIYDRAKIILEKNKKFLTNVFSLIMLQGGQYVLTLATLPYLARVLSPSQFGIYGFALAISQYCIIATNYGFDISATKDIAINKENKEKISSLFWNVLAAKFFLAILCFFFLILLCTFIPQLYDCALIIVLASTQVIGSVLFPNWFFQGVEKLWGITVSNLIARGCGLLFILCLVKSKDDLMIAIIIQSLVTISSGLIGFTLVLSKKLVVKSKITFHFVFFNLKKSFSFFISNVAISFYTLSTVIVLGIFSSSRDAGLFNGVDKIRMAVTGIVIIMNGAIYPRIISILENDERKAAWFIKNVAIFKLVITFFMSFLLYLFSNEVVYCILGNEYSNAVVDMKIMSPLIFLVTASVILANYILLPFGYNKVFVSIPIVVAVVHIAIAIPLCLMWGATGGAIAIFISEALTNILLLYFAITYGLVKKVMESKND
ncbi:flippase [Zymobacter palmae]|nr:flippase [Zymobacter palmae]